MKEKQIKVPGPDHPISIQHNCARVVVSVAGRVIADTRSALTLREADYPLFNTFRVRTWISPSWNGQITLPTVRTKAIAITTAFPLGERSPSMPCGRTRIRILLLRRSGTMSRSIPSGSTR